MTKPTPNSRLDAVLRIVEDVILVAATGLGTWQGTHNANDVVGAVIAAPVVRSGVAAALSSGRVSGLVLALKLVRKALGALDATEAAPAPAPEAATPAP